MFRCDNLKTYFTIVYDLKNRFTGSATFLNQTEKMNF